MHTTGTGKVVSAEAEMENNGEVRTELIEGNGRCTKIRQSQREIEPHNTQKKNPKTIIPTLGELWSASAASCGTRVQRNENPNEKMEKNETICVSAPLSLRH